MSDQPKLKITIGEIVETEVGDVMIMGSVSEYDMSIRVKHNNSEYSISGPPIIMDMSNGNIEFPPSTNFNLHEVTDTELFSEVRRRKKIMESKLNDAIDELGKAIDETGANETT